MTLQFHIQALPIIMPVIINSVLYVFEKEIDTEASKLQSSQVYNKFCLKMIGSIFWQ